MPKVNYTKAIQREYLEMFKSIEIKLEKLKVVEYHVDHIAANRNRYETIEAKTNVPWYFIALVHTLEASRNFNLHLHNGDLLTARTVNVPSGRPKKGNPPFSWEDSCEDAIKLKRLDKETDWSLSKTLYNLENYNGWGYRLYHTHVKSPYLWSYSNHYTSGKYTSDGVFSNTAVSGQCGSAVILRRLEQRNIIPELDISLLNNSFYFHSNKVAERAEDLQRFLNTLPGISLLVDGKPGNKTSEACNKIFGEYLTGDKRRP